MKKTWKKISGVVVILAAAAALLICGIWLGFVAGKRSSTNIVVTGVSNINVPSSSIADFSTFWQAWQTINDNYLRNPSTTAQQKVQGAINGLVNSLGDPYTEYFTPADNQQFQQDITGNFGGIGAQLGEDKDNHLVVIAPLKGTPAEAAGLKPEDWITAINGSSTDSINVDQAVDLIRGKTGTTVTLSIFRSGFSAPKDYKLTRADIKVPDVDFSMKGNIAVIAFHEFTQDSDNDFYQALVQAQKANAKGMIIDLRDNPGGYLNVAVDLSGYFLKAGAPVVKEVGRTIQEEDYTSTGQGTFAGFPMAILINGGSASAAEILAGALHDSGGVPLVGEKSFGKGTVQELEPLADGSAIKVTIAHWVLPSGQILDHDGLVPTDPVTISDDDIAKGLDPQMDKAVQVVQAQMAK